MRPPSAPIERQCAADIPYTVGLSFGLQGAMLGSGGGGSVAAVWLIMHAGSDVPVYSVWNMRHSSPALSPALL